MDTVNHSVEFVNKDDIQVFNFFPHKPESFFATPTTGDLQQSRTRTRNSHCHATQGDRNKDYSE